MKLNVTRDDLQQHCTLGTLTIDGRYACQTLEDVDRKLEDDPDAKIPGQTAIPRGAYKVIIDYSQHFGKELPHVLDVPGYQGVRIHPGNDADDTEGCILVGTVRSGDRILNSRIAFADLFLRMRTAIARGEEITLEVM